VERFIEHTQFVSTNNYNTLKFTVIIAHKIRSSTSACKSLLSNESYLVSTTQLNTQLLNCFLNSLTNDSIELKNERSVITTD
jgi:hypothetical protein